MEQPITDYVGFLADARYAVEQLNCDRGTAARLEAEERKKERELEAAKKAVTDSINQTVRKRLEEINASYDREIGVGQERLKKARVKREKAKNQGMKERIAEETLELREHNRELKLEIRTLFQRSRVPAFCNSTFYYALYYPKGIKEYAILLVTFLVFFLGVPCGIYYLIPKQNLLCLIAVYVADVFLFGGLYVAISNRTKFRYQDALKKGRAIRSVIRANRRKIKVIVHTIKRDGNEDIYDLEKYDDEIACIEQELSEIAQKKKEAVNTFETVTKTIISDEIVSNSKSRIEKQQEELDQTTAYVKEIQGRVKQQALQMADRFEPYIGKEFLQPDRLGELSKLIQSGSAANISEAIEQYTKSRQ